MKLVFFRDPRRNFGDDLNPWLWDRLLPGVADEDPRHLLLGVGTILEPWFVEELAPAAVKVVIGAGAGMSVPPIAPDGTWRIYCVRGPLTASYLGLDPGLAATDPAMCLRDLWTAPAGDRRRIGFMPHHTSLRTWDWRRTCERAGLDYIDPHGDVLETIGRISQLKLILTEAMHGAIVADALRVPWFPLQINPLNYIGKWHDWSASIRVPIHFKPLPFLYDPLADRSMASLMRGNLRDAAHALRRRSSRRQADQAARLLRRYADDYDAYLSDERDLDRAVGRFHEALERFRRDRRDGAFA